MKSQNIHGTVPLNTPWGHADQHKTLAPGIGELSTPSHGGYWLSDARLAEMHPCLTSHKTFGGRANWFEEDCDWVIPVLAFPEHFSAFTVYHAVQMVKSRCGSQGYYKFDLTEYCLQTKAGAQARAMADLWFSENSEKFMFGCQGGGSGGCWGGLDRIDGGESLRYKCAKWPTLHQPFTLDQARADGLEILPIAPPVIAPEPVKFRPVNTPDAGPAHDHRYYQPFDESQCGGVFDGVNTVTSDADSGL